MHPPHDFLQAHAHYGTVRRVVFEETIRAAVEVGLAGSDCVLTEIDLRVLLAWREQWRDRRHWTGEGGWRWDAIARRYRAKPRSFHVAVWHGRSLCGLCVGSLSDGHCNLMLHFMESAPDPDHPLRGVVTFVVFTAAEFYARATGAERLVLRNPLEGVMERYGTFGFRLAYVRGGMVYFQKEIARAQERP